MNRYKISSLYIKNFKCITEAEFLFDNNNLVVYDGPNGYGKTTCFEAIEILFAGTPRKSQTSFVDKRYKFRDSPIHKDNRQEIVISVNLMNSDGEKLLITRKFPAAAVSHSNDNNFAKIFGLSKLYINDSSVESTNEEIEEILKFDNIGSLFNLLNYVEQDENTYFLKKDPKNRYSSLESLLGGEEERALLSKLNDLKDKIKKKRKEYSDEIVSLQKNNQEALYDDLSKLEFKQLIQERDLDWDKLNVKNTDPDIHKQYLIELSKIEYLIANIDVIEKVLSNQFLNTFINSNSIDLFLRFYWSVSNLDTLRQENDRRKVIEGTIENNRRIVESIDTQEYNKLGISGELDYIAQKEGLLELTPFYRSSLVTILSMQEALSTDHKILSDLREKRELLFKLNLEHRKLIPIKDSECPTCGYDWNTSAALLEQVKNTEEKIFKTYLESNSEFERIKKSFNETTLEGVRLFLENEIEQLKAESSELVDSKSFLEIIDYQNKDILFNEFLSIFTDETKNQIFSIVNRRDIEDISLAKENLLSLIEVNKPVLEESIDQLTIKNNFEFYFSSKMDALKEIDKEIIDSKREYIQWQFYNSISQNITVRQQKWESLDQAFNKINSLAGKVESQINKYTSSIVEKIKIPFHIYTGKILQNHSLGSGLNIDFEMEKQKQLYITPSYKDQEVAFTLSSGQLSATVISLMLVLNKVFNQSQLGTIFIDDPLQTLDEINAHSLVELLKYNFSDDQIVLSTHEDKYSRFIRYKFEKFGLSNKNINMRDWN
ncbi:AAA family ATPase [Sphingobacterium faecium]|uniref:AAA family ATPase n=1 Tax=Sphingobacterium faecium TaxID=34087 RepID=UPI0032082A94